MAFSGVKMSNLTEFKIMRVRKGLTQVGLSQRLGMSQQAVSQWESGRSKPPVSIIRRLANLLDVDIEELLKCFE